MLGNFLNIAIAGLAAIGQLHNISAIQQCDAIAINIGYCANLQNKMASGSPVHNNGQVQHLPVGQ